VKVQQLITFEMLFMKNIYCVFTMLIFLFFFSPNPTQAQRMDTSGNQWNIFEALSDNPILTP